MRSPRQWIPNLLSISRVPLGLAFLLLYDTSDVWLFASALSIAGIAFLTDVADGRLARRWHTATATGALIDGLGDKAFYVAVYLVILAEQAAHSLLIWGLIFREIALYGLRTIDSDRAINTRQLRWASLAYAFVIRVYFLCFFVAGACDVAHRATPTIIKFGFVFGYLALILGYIGLAKLISQMDAKN